MPEHSPTGPHAPDDHRRHLPSLDASTSAVPPATDTDADPRVPVPAPESPALGTRGRRWVRPRVLVPLAAITAAVVSGALLVPGGGNGSPVGLGATAPVAFESFDSCDALLRYFHEQAGRRVGPYGLVGAIGGTPIRAFDEVTAGGAAASSPVPGAAKAENSTSSDVGGSTSDTGTTVQVAGVDEADLVKITGDRVVLVVNGALRVARLVHGRAQVTGSLTLTGWNPDQLLVHGDHALVLGTLNTYGYAIAEDMSSGSAASGSAGSADGASDGAVPGVASPGDPGVVPGTTSAQPDPDWSGPITRIAEVDLTDVTRPRIVRTLDLDGDLVGARLTGDRATLALNSSSGRLPWVNPSSPSTRAIQQATRTNRAVVAASTLDDWLPHYRLTSYDRSGRVTATSPTRELLDCSSVSAPRTFSGLDSVSLVRFDLTGDGIAHWTGAGVVASGATLYQTATHAYLATVPWTATDAPVPAPAALDDATVSGTPSASPTTPSAADQERTQIHLFDLTGARPEYLASGSVSGSLLGQYAMDEYDGVLRVASTTDRSLIEPMAVEAPDAKAASAAPAEAAAPSATPGSTSVTQGLVPSSQKPLPATQNQITVLKPDGDRLAEVGSVGGLGAGETLRAVRFLGPVGYLVTFRQTDPLFTVDLADPRHPRVAGTLELRGYSAFLQPAGSGLLLGIGQDATATGVTQALQLSLFDVSDPAAPRRLDRVRLTGAWSQAESDPHAFTFVNGLVLTPFTRTCLITPLVRDPDLGTGPGSLRRLKEQCRYGQESGVLAVRLTGRSLGNPTVLHPLAAGAMGASTGGKGVASEPDLIADAVPLRALVADSLVVTITSAGIATHHADTLARIDFTRF